MAHLIFLARRSLVDLRSGLLFLPGLILFGFVLLALFILALDSRPAVEAWVSAVSGRLGGLLGLGPDPARLVLGSLAGFMLTAVATLYSSLLVVQTLASSQFSPRILGSLLRDGHSQAGVGYLVGTLVFSLMNLMAVRDQPPLVPRLGLLVSLGLGLCGLAVFMHVIAHMSKRVQIGVTMDVIASRAERTIDEVFAPLPAGWLLPTANAPDDLATGAGGPWRRQESSRSGFVQSIDTEWLFRVAVRHDLELDLGPQVGDFVVAGTPILRLRGAADPRLPRRLEAAFDLGPVRTIDQDPAFALRQLVDVALKALSPAVNDPGTAVGAMDHCLRLLIRASSRPEGPHGRADSAGRPRLWLRPQRYAELLRLAFSQLRVVARSDFSVCYHLAKALAALAGLPLPADRAQAVAHELAGLAAVCQAEAWSEEERTRFNAVLERARRELGA